MAAANVAVRDQYLQPFLPLLKCLLDGMSSPGSPFQQGSTESSENVGEVGTRPSNPSLHRTPVYQTEPAPPARCNTPARPGCIPVELPRTGSTWPRQASSINAEAGSFACSWAQPKKARILSSFLAHEKLKYGHSLKWSDGGCFHCPGGGFG